MAFQLGPRSLGGLPEFCYKMNRENMLSFFIKNSSGVPDRWGHASLAILVPSCFVYLRKPF